MKGDFALALVWMDWGREGGDGIFGDDIDGCGFCFNPLG
jgi:hypothetical protein